MKSKITLFVFPSLVSMFALSACSLEANFTPINVDLPGLDTVLQQRSEPDFVSAEIVTVSSPSGSVVITGSFGDITTEVHFNNGITIEGAFYQ